MNDLADLNLLQNILKIADQADGNSRLARYNGRLNGNDVAEAIFGLQGRIQDVLKAEHPDHNHHAIGLLREVADLIRRGRQVSASFGVPGCIPDDEDALSGNDVAQAIFELEPRMRTTLAADPRAKVNGGYIPPWLNAILSPQDRAIVAHPQSKALNEDQEGNRLPMHQQWIESPIGSIWIDAKAKAILGYGPGSERFLVPELRKSARP